MQIVFAVYAVTLALCCRNSYRIPLLPECVKYFVLYQPPYLFFFGFFLTYINNTFNTYDINNQTALESRLGLAWFPLRGVHFLPLCTMMGTETMHRQSCRWYVTLNRGVKQRGQWKLSRWGRLLSDKLIDLLISGLTDSTDVRCRPFLRWNSDKWVSWKEVNLN